MKRLLALLCAMMALTSAASAETIRFYGMAAPDAFVEAHPGVTIDNSAPASYNTTSEYAGALQTRTFRYDVFHVYTDNVDARLMMEKGYLLDLSGSEVIRGALSRMHPYIAERCMVDGRIYGIPMGVSVQATLGVNRAAWEEAGYRTGDIPQSYPALLDFIEGYLDRREDEPQLEINVWNGLDEDGYGPHTYAEILVRRLVDSHVLQSQYAEIPVRFGTPEMIALLERARALGERVYTYEPTKNHRMPSTTIGLFELAYPGRNVGWDEVGERCGSLRITEEQPRLMAASIHLYAASAAVEHPELVVEAMACYLDEMMDSDAVLLYADALPIANDLAASDRMTLNLIALAEHRLAGDESPWTDYLDMAQDPDSNEDLTAFYGEMAAQLWDDSEQEVREQLDKWQIRVTNRDPYRFSPEELAAYQRMAPTLYLQSPSVFDASGEGGQSFTALLRQFTDGLISAEQFAREADRIAEMIELENR